KPAVLEAKAFRKEEEGEMSGFVGVWMGVIAKLGIEQQTTASCSFMRREEDEDKGREKPLSVKKKKEAVQEKKMRVSLSEATVCMLMDRFAPS
ncbi:hypothetical protein BHE74_00047860, partial [Ensete ventricosum]